MLEPSKEHTCKLELGVLAGSEAIGAFAKSLPSLNTRDA